MEMTIGERARLTELQAQFDAERFIAGRELAEFALLFVADKDDSEAMLVLYRALDPEHPQGCACKACLG